MNKNHKKKDVSKMRQSIIILLYKPNIEWVVESSTIEWE